MAKTQYEREQEYRSDRGYIGTGGIVICGQCREDLRFAAAFDLAKAAAFQQEAWERYNPAEGDDWCSICDRDITKKWRDSNTID